MKRVIFIILVMTSFYNQAQILTWPRSTGVNSWGYWFLNKVIKLKKSQKAYGLVKFLTPANSFRQRKNAQDYLLNLEAYEKEHNLLTNKKIEKSRFFTLKTLYNFSSKQRDEYGVKEPLSWAYQKESSLPLKVACPQSLEIMQVSRNKLYPYKKNTLSFINHKEEFKKFSSDEFGFCWGHAYVTAALRYLAFFDPDNLEHIDVAYKTDKWRELIMRKLDNMIKYGKPEVLPYLSSIRELSEEFEDELKKKVIYSWGVNAPTINNLIKTYDNENTYSLEFLEDFIFVVKKRLAMGQTPLLNFSLWGRDQWNHVVLIYGYRYLDDKIEFFLDDNKFSVEEDEPNQRSRLIIDLKTKEIHYSLGDILAGIKKVGRIYLPIEDYLFYGKITPSLQQFCEQYQ